MSVCGRNVLCESDSLLNHGAKIQHSVLPIIRFYTFPAIRGYFIKFLTKLSYYTRNTHLPFAKQKLLRLASQPRMFESEGGNQTRHQDE